MADLLAERLNDWLESSTDQVAGKLLGSEMAPPQAKATEAQKRAFFAAHLFNPDGTPNDDGRNALIVKYGPQGFAQIAKTLLKQHTALHADLADLPDPIGGE